MIFAQTTSTGFDVTKSFNGQGMLTLGVVAVIVTVLCNVDKIWKAFQAWKSKTTTLPDYNAGDTISFRTEEQEEREPTEAEYRVIMFGWIDDIRSYAMANKNQPALTTANKLINDLLATESTKEEPSNAIPKTSS